MQRDVVRLVTPGTLTEESLLDAARQQLPHRLFAVPAEPATGSRARLGRYFDGRTPRCGRACNDLSGELAASPSR